MQKIARGLSGRIERDFFYFGEFAAMGDNYAVNRAVRRDRNAVNNAIDRIAQEFKTGNERDVQLAASELSAECRWMIENDVSFPAVNEGAGIEILDAADAERIQVTCYQ